jgi:hypothetical protein
VRRRNVSGAGLAASFDTSGDVQAIVINRNWHETTTRGQENMPR